jgi:AraC family transcriptional regulator, positive regulator of tynA and feaB
MRIPEHGGERKSDIDVWDTQYIPPAKAFRFYRDALCSVYMPWMASSDDATEFNGRFESARVNGGTISRSRCSPMVCIRNRPEVAHSDDECFYVLYVLSGYHACEQRGRKSKAQAGEIIVVDSSQVCRVETGDPPYDVMCVTVPKAHLSGIHHLEDKLANVRLGRSISTDPLLSCASLMSKQFTSVSEIELGAFYSAFVSLLPLAGGCFEDDNKEKFYGSPHNTLLRAIEEFTERNISDPTLSAHSAAEKFGISVRYVHKLFACSGRTYNSFVAAMRLEHIRNDLLSPPRRRQKVSDLAFRWGFNDLSTFNRAFKRRFGCSPSRYRTR